MSLLSTFFAPFKTYFYGAIVTIGLAFSIYVVIHERHVGEATIAARDVVINTQRTAIASAAELHTKDVEALAQLKSQQIGEHYDEILHTPISDSPRVVCLKPAATPGSGLVPKAASGGSGDSGAPVSASQDPIDIGAPLDTIGRDADAQINALIDQVQVLEDAMNGKTK